MYQIYYEQNKTLGKKYTIFIRNNYLESKLLVRVIVNTNDSLQKENKIWTLHFVICFQISCGLQNELNFIIKLYFYLCVIK